MGFEHRVYMRSTEVYGCARCHTHLVAQESLISQEFNGQLGRASLYDSAANILEGEVEECNMRTGKHIIRHIFCARCGYYLGWKYDYAFSEGEKYKEGKFIFEVKQLATLP